MEHEIKDLDILSKYLSEEELKEVAKSVAYKAFSSHMGVSNPHNKVNLDYYAGHGAYLAVKQHLTDGEIEEFGADLKVRVKGMIGGMQSYQLPTEFKDLVKEAVTANREVIQTKVNQLVKQFLDNPTKYDSAFGELTNYIGELMSELLLTSLKENLNK